MKKYLLFYIGVILFAGNSIYANDKPGGTDLSADFSYYIEFVGISADVSFLNESTGADTYYWDFGDGFSSTDINPFHNYALPGLYVVCLTASNVDGSVTYCDTINTYYAPSSAFNFTGDPEVTFTDISTNFPTTWFWEFGDGDTSTLQNPVHTYLTNGSYTVCQSVGNPGGTNYSCQTLEITSYLITEAAFYFSGDPDVLFTDLSTNSPFSWQWDFGDGDNSTLQNPEHTYSENGTYNVCLIATNAGGSDTACANVTISTIVLSPVADFTYILSYPDIPFTDLSVNTPTSWDWDFGDGTTSTEQNPVHTFGDYGSYYVCLTASNTAGSNTECKYVLLQSGVSDKYIPSVSVYPNPAENTFTIQLNEIFSNSSIELFDITGQKININVKNISDSQIQVHAENIANGNYVLRIQNKNTEVGKQLIIQNK